MKNCVGLLALFVALVVVVKAKEECAPEFKRTACFIDPCWRRSFRALPCKKDCYSDSCGGCNAYCKCDDDPDCEDDEFCRPSCSGEVKMCIPKSKEDGPCGGSVDCGETRCGEGLKCLTGKDDPDHGTCVSHDVETICDEENCPPGKNKYCAYNGECLREGRCVSSSDCLNPQNTWFHDMCIGTSTCRMGLCNWQCRGASTGSTGSSTGSQYSSTGSSTQGTGTGATQNTYAQHHTGVQGTQDVQYGGKTGGHSYQTDSSSNLGTGSTSSKTSSKTGSYGSGSTSGSSGYSSSSDSYGSSGSGSSSYGSSGSSGYGSSGSSGYGSSGSSGYGSSGSGYGSSGSGYGSAGTGGYGGY